MRFTFYGAARSVTGSCHMTETNGLKILVDCGLRQGRDAKQEMGAGGLAFDAREIDFVLLTHAHIDHSGLLPLLVKKGFEGRIVCTSATAELVEIMLADSGHIQEIEAEWKNRKNNRAGKPSEEPLYTALEAAAVKPYITTVEYEETFALGENVRTRFVDAGHLFGSASIELTANENGREVRAVFSGDLGNKGKPIINDPVAVESADYLFLESTYGDRLHEDTRPPREQLKDILVQALQRGGNIVIPSFAVGRTQEVLYELSVLLDEGGVPGLERTPVYLDSPLAIAATEIFKRKFLRYYDREAIEYLNNGVSFFGFKTLRISQTAEESKAINDLPGPKIIISSSGMCEAGRIKHHLKHSLWRADSTVLFVGYQAEGTLGRQILDGEKRVKIFNENIRVNAAVSMIDGFSGHADRDGLIEWLQYIKTPVRKIFLVHGEQEAMLHFQKTLQDLGYDALAPQLHESYDTQTDNLALTRAAAASHTEERLRRILRGIETAVEAGIQRGDAAALAPVEEELRDLLERLNHHKVEKGA